MIVCAHGAVADFCKAHDMVIVDRYEGDIESYKGVCRVLVTDQELSEYEYYFLKGKMFAAGVELISTRYVDQMDLFGVIKNSPRGKNGGRHKFGFHREDGELKFNDGSREVVKRIFELRDMGYTYRAIQEDSGVHHPDGRKIAISTIQIILKNRKKYEEEGL